jgi:hypothetical protein
MKIDSSHLEQFEPAASEHAPSPWIDRQLAAILHHDRCSLSATLYPSCSCAFPLQWLSPLVFHSSNFPYARSAVPMRSCTRIRDGSSSWTRIVAVVRVYMVR